MPRKNPLAVPQLRAEPQYRFWGSRKPPETRDPIRAQVDVGNDGNGTAVIRIYDPIDSWGGIWGVSAKEFAEALDLIGANVNTIELRLNSPGGESWEAIAILNMLRQHDATVVAIVEGLAASAASFLAAGVDQCVMMPNSQLMIHDAWGLCVGPAEDMQHMADLLSKVSNNIASIYADKAGGSVEQWRAAMLEETWYDADEAVTANLADRVDAAVEPAPPLEPVEDDDEPELFDKFDLSQFKHAGRNDAPAPASTPAAFDQAAASTRARHLALREKQPA